MRAAKGDDSRGRTAVYCSTSAAITSNPRWSIDGGIEAGRGLAKEGKCKYDGLYCLNDGIALGILRGGWMTA